MQNEILAAGIVILTVFIVTWLGRQNATWIQQILNWFPAILFAYVIPAAFTHAFGLELSAVSLHSLSKNWIIPFAILTVMSALPFAQLKIVGIRPILVFVVGSFVIAVLPVILVYAGGVFSADVRYLFINQEYWKGLVPIVGGWIGGSTSQLVLKELAGTEEALFLSILVLDNILVNIWTILMFQFIKKSDALNKIFGIRTLMPSIVGDDKKADTSIQWPIILVVIVACTIVTNLFIDDFLLKIVILSVLGLVLGNVVTNWNVRFVLQIGGIAILLIMAILGLKLNFSNLSLPLVLVLVVITWLILHFVFMLLTAIVLRVNIAWVAIGSMANLGGISTAPAVTSAYKKELMPHAILLAILSMVSGTAWGMFTIYLFSLFH